MKKLLYIILISVLMSAVMSCGRSADKKLVLADSCGSIQIARLQSSQQSTVIHCKVTRTRHIMPSFSHKHSSVATATALVIL